MDGWVLFRGIVHSKHNWQEIKTLLNKHWAHSWRNSRPRRFQNLSLMVVIVQILPIALHNEPLSKVKYGLTTWQMRRLARLLGSSERQLPKTVIVWLTSQSWPFGSIPLSDRNAFLNSLYAFLVLNVVYYTFQLSKRPNSFVYLEQHTLSLCCLLNYWIFVLPN